MTLIHVPSPSQSAMNPDRPVSSLLKIQMEHLQQAEKRLPPVIRPRFTSTRSRQKAKQQITFAPLPRRSIPHTRKQPRSG